MIVDSSAILATIKNEPERPDFAAALERANDARISAANYFETAILIDSYKSPTLAARFEELMERAQIVIEPVTAEQARIARQAYRDYGKGSGHKAQLNFGDCFSYALARNKREPLLYKGEDFIHTDLRAALDPLP
jgi:ribonuclease VapC